MPKVIAYVTRRVVAFTVLETGLILGAIAAAVLLQRGPDELAVPLSAVAQGLLIALACQVSLYYCELYDLQIAADPLELLLRLVQSVGIMLLLLGFVYLWRPELAVGRDVFFVAAFLIVLAVCAWRLIFHWLNRKVRPRERWLLVGTSPAAVALAREIHDRTELGLEIIGFIDPDPLKVGTPLFNPGVLGTVEDIPRIAHERTVDRIVVSLADARGKLPMGRLLEMKLNGMKFDHLADVYEEYTGKIAVENLRPSWLIFSTGFRKSRLLIRAKRSLDVLAAVVGLILLGPLMALVAVTILLTSPAAPVLYRQKRVGQDGRVFTVCKFRSMKPHAEAACGAMWSPPDDPRITRLGRVLRRWRVDELPQLGNLLQGDMSMVGPRPERPEFVGQLSAQIPFYGQRHVVKPGLTGWAQVCYTYGASVEDALQKLQYDLFYIKHLSLTLDLFIIAKTVKTVLLGQGR